jgi:hypothetical protein
LVAIDIGLNCVQNKNKSDLIERTTNAKSHTFFSPVTHLPRHYYKLLADAIYGFEQALLASSDDNHVARTLPKYFSTLLLQLYFSRYILFFSHTNTFLSMPCPWFEGGEELATLLAPVLAPGGKCTLAVAMMLVRLGSYSPVCGLDFNQHFPLVPFVACCLSKLQWRWWSRRDAGHGAQCLFFSFANSGARTRFSYCLLSIA